MKWLLQLLLPVAVAAGLLTGLLALGKPLRDRLRQEGQMTISPADVECDPPPGLTRQEFLEEVQYLANLPDRLDLLDEGTNARVEQAIASHPWVVRVIQVQQLPTRRLRIDLEYRRPVLVVGPQGRIVDVAGVLLPMSAPSKGLPVLEGKFALPPPRSGQPWKDPAVLAAARVAEQVQPHLTRLGLEDCRMEVRQEDVVLRTAEGRLVWGRPPGQEKSGEATAEVKVKRIPAARELAGHEWDLRPVAAAKPKALPPPRRK